MHSSLMLLIILIVHSILMSLGLLILFIVLIVLTASIQPKRYTFPVNAYNESSPNKGNIARGTDKAC